MAKIEVKFAKLELNCFNWKRKSSIEFNRRVNLGVYKLAKIGNKLAKS